MLKNMSEMVKKSIIGLGFVLVLIGTCCCVKSEKNIKADFKKSFISTFRGTCIGGDSEVIDDLTNSAYYLQVAEDAIKNNNIQKCEEAYYNFYDIYNRKLRHFVFNGHIVYGGHHNKEAHEALVELNFTLFEKHAHSIEKNLEDSNIKLKKKL